MTFHLRNFLLIISKNNTYFLSRKRKFEKDLLAEGFFVNYDEIVNHASYGGQNGKVGNGSICSKVQVTTGLLTVEYRFQPYFCDCD